MTETNIQDTAALIRALAEILFGMIIFSLVVSLLFWPAWNLVMPGVFHLPTVGYWKSAALMFLITLISSTVRGKLGDLHM